MQLKINIRNSISPFLLGRFKESFQNKNSLNFESIASYICVCSLFYIYFILKLNCLFFNFYKFVLCKKIFKFNSMISMI